MKKGEIRLEKLVNKVLFSTKVVKYYKHSLCDRKPILNLLLLQTLICLLLVGCVSTRHAQVGKSTPSTVGQSKEATKYHTVQKGDTLYSIAQIYGIDYKELAAWNNIENPGTINVGQQLMLSSPNLMTKPSVFALPDPEPSSTVRQSIPEATSISNEEPTSAVTLLKIEPKSLKLPYSEQAISQLQESENVLPTAIANANTNSKNEKPAEPDDTAAITSTETLRDNSGIGWIWPTEGRVSSHFSESTKGMDISGKTGQPVLASAAGKVVYSGTGLRGYGQLIIIKHNSTYLSAYAHNSKLLVKEGQTVSRGQKIAEMGNTDSKLVRLHFEIRKNGKPVDPLKHLPKISSETVL
jgi:lipoprotein NlpD